MTITLKKALAVAALSISTASFAPAAFAADITGAGATFPYPIYAKWAEAYKARTAMVWTINQSALQAVSNKLKPRL